MNEPDGRGHNRGSELRWRLRGALLGGVIATVFQGCDDPDKMFEGRWESVTVVEGSSFLAGRPELSIGHYGRELTGVVRFLDRNGLATDGCACAFIEHQRVDLERERFVAITEHCDGQAWIWELTRIEDDDDTDVLEGTVVPAAGGEPVFLSLRLVDEFVSDERRECAR
jgi:hypothetical protein